MLTDCISRNTTQTEILIVQEFYGPISKHLRNRHTQAVLPIGRDIVRIVGRPLDRVLDCESVKEIIGSLGVGICLRPSRGRETPGFSLEGLRYGKIILAFDSTPEGNYIQAQILSYFHRFSDPILHAGKLYGVAALDSAEIPEDEWEAKVMDPDSRRLFQASLGKSLKETVRLFDEQRLLT